MARTTNKRARGDGELGARIRRRRKALGLAAKDLARAAGVSPSYVSQLEHGTQERPSLDVVHALAVALGLSSAELFGEPVAVALPPTIPPVLAALAGDLGLDARTTEMLAGIHIDGRQPRTHDGWLLIILAIRHACVADTTASPVAASG
jgi:transcriptional regulator with XRE-family HTH domain